MGKTKEQQEEEEVRTKLGRSVAHRDLPKIPKDLPPDSVSLVLFYQYIEPMWTTTEHKQALKFVMNLGRELGVTGRGRCAAEGLNCTLTGTPKAIRDFCYGLREWKGVFNECDFKITDGLKKVERFKALTIRKTEELVAYGLRKGDTAPPLQDNKTRHVEAAEYHEMMAQPNTVIIDIRNAYENAIGHFQPPDGGAELIDPKMRLSYEFPKWLNTEETQKKLTGKTVMMYCTGGIRCERASALISQLAEVNEEFKPKDLVMVRGGIERYLKTFPEGGYWKGQNYLFDRRFSQKPELKSDEAIEKDTVDLARAPDAAWKPPKAHCSICKKPYAQYRGQHKCARQGCGVPVIVCLGCQEVATADKKKCICGLCEEGFELRREAEKPDLDLMNSRGKKRSAEDSGARKALKMTDPDCRLFVGKLPLTVDARAIRGAFRKGGPEDCGPGAKKQKKGTSWGPEKTAGDVAKPAELSADEDQVRRIHWITDQKTRLFYGSAFVELKSLKAAKAAVERASEEGIKVKGQRIRVAFSAPHEGTWPPAEKETERPVVPV